MNTTILSLLILLHITPGDSVFSGFLHPLHGIDHLLAMVSVGLLSAQMGGRAIWTVPATFVAVMTIGGLLGIVGVGLPWVEYAIAVSVLVLGVALTANKALPTLLVIGFVGLFALFHGHAHGTELPALDKSTTYVTGYIVGFIVSTAGLHVIGALMGLIGIRSSRGVKVLRISGACIAAIGVALVISVSDLIL